MRLRIALSAHNRNNCCNGGITASSRLINRRFAPMAKQEKQKKQLDELFHETLKDIYYAEKKLVSTLPKMAKAAHSDELKAAFEKHLAETEGQVERLEQVFAMIDETPKGKTCDAINGLVDEGKEIMVDFKRSPAHDAGLLAAAQAVEHYE